MYVGIKFQSDDLLSTFYHKGGMPEEKPKVTFGFIDYTQAKDGRDGFLWQENDAAAKVWALTIHNFEYDRAEKNIIKK